MNEAIWVNQPFNFVFHSPKVTRHVFSPCLTQRQDEVRQQNFLDLEAQIVKWGHNSTLGTISTNQTNKSHFHCHI